MPGLGFYGKLPAHGDFVRRGVSPALATAWDGWLSALMATVRDDLGEEEWLDVYLTGPVWRFALGAGVAGVAQTGVMVPSVDRVGRYFPLVLTAPLDGPRMLTMALRHGRGLLNQMEDLACRALESDSLDADDLMAQLEALAWDWPDPDDGPAGAGDSSRPGVWVPLGEAEPCETVTGLAWLMTDASGPKGDSAAGLWWTDGSERVGGGVLRTRGWPPIPQAVAFLDGAWAERGWTGWSRAA